MSFNLIYANIYLSVYVVVVCAHMTIINLRCKKKRIVQKRRKEEKVKSNSNRWSEKEGSLESLPSAL